jgi:hypothetical protein
MGHCPGKSREIDMTAESAAGSFRRGVCVKTTFVIEAVNNRFPVILLTERPSSPNADFESYLKFSTSPNPCVVTRPVTNGKVLSGRFGSFAGGSPCSIGVQLA